MGAPAEPVAQPLGLGFTQIGSAEGQFHISMHLFQRGFVHPDDLPGFLFFRFFLLFSGGFRVRTGHKIGFVLQDPFQGIFPCFFFREGSPVGLTHFFQRDGKDLF